MDKNGKALSAVHELGTTKHKCESEQAGRQRRLGSFAMVSSSYTNHLRIGDLRLNATPAKQRHWQASKQSKVVPHHAREHLSCNKSDEDRLVPEVRHTSQGNGATSFC